MSRRIPIRPKLPVRPSSVIPGRGRGFPSGSVSKNPQDIEGKSQMNNKNTEKPPAAQAGTSKTHSEGSSSRPSSGRPDPIGTRRFPAPPPPPKLIGPPLGQEAYPRISKRGIVNDRGKSGNRDSGDGESSARSGHDSYGERTVASGHQSRSDSDSEDSEPVVFSRDKLRDQGTHIARCIRDPNEPGCKTPSSSLTFQKLKNWDPNLNVEYNDGSWADFLFASSYELPPGVASKEKEGSKSKTWFVTYNPTDAMSGAVRTTDNFDPLENVSVFPDRPDCFVGSTMPNKIVLQRVARRGEYFPHISEIALALYRNDYGADKPLKTVNANTVVNKVTRAYLVGHIYNRQWSIKLDEARKFTPGSKYYEEILGTPIGKIVGNLVLGGFPRGSVRIANIVCYASPKRTVIPFLARAPTTIDGYDLHLEFNLEHLDPKRRA